MKRFYIAIAWLFLWGIILSFSPLNAEDASSSASSDAARQKVLELERKVNDLKEQNTTLSSQISFMDTQMSLTELKIQQTEATIVNIQKEIEILGTRIEGLDSSLNSLSEQLLQRVVEGYKNKSLSVFDIIFDSINANEFLAKLKYLRTAQENNQKILLQVQETKLNFEEQKKLREDKKIQLDKLTITLNDQKNTLESQKKAKESLLSITRNSEVVYQNLLEKARRELQGFSSFTQSQGGGLRSFGGGSNGWYYSQRDPSWGNYHIGSSNYLVWKAGCALTSVAMVCKSYGQNISPADMALDYSKFINGDLMDNQFSCAGKGSSILWNVGMDTVKQYVNKNIPVILRLVAPSVSGLHFIVAWKWDGNDFIIHDPYNGPDLKFTSLYNWSQVSNAIVID
ncbi:hypothetical protein HGA88_00950 [Candidatus Roizmanbacteria bacterium]|nr:hypothetical protein [Candidatus Roizmanbacteria bacterium]